MFNPTRTVIEAFIHETAILISFGKRCGRISERHCIIFGLLKKANSGWPISAGVFFIRSHASALSSGLHQRTQNNGATPAAFAYLDILRP